MRYPKTVPADSDDSSFLIQNWNQFNFPFWLYIYLLMSFDSLITNHKSVVRNQSGQRSPWFYKIAPSHARICHFILITNLRCPNHYPDEMLHNEVKWRSHNSPSLQFNLPQLMMMNGSMIALMINGRIKSIYYSRAGIRRISNSCLRSVCSTSHVLSFVSRDQNIANHSRRFEHLARIVRTYF